VTLTETMEALRAAGSPQTRKTYLRHGYPEDTFGVSFADLKRLAKKLDGDQQLARALWATGNGDACTLAAMIADPGETSPEELDRWVSQVRYSLLAQMLSRYVADTEFAREKAEQWTRSAAEHTGETGYYVLAQLALKDEGLPDEYFEDYVRTIERTIHGAKNYTRYAMNQALIAIGVRNPHLTQVALEAAGRIGKVHVDHGDTACKTPDAAAYIRKTLATAAETKPRAKRRQR
jgi:3-methyladenine DNA glycosylase AlkD